METSPDPQTEYSAPLDQDASQPAQPDSAEPQLLDVNGDGITDSIYVRIDAAVSFVVVDADDDAEADTAYIDINADGAADVVVSESEGGYELSLVSDPTDMQWVSREELTTLVPELVAALDHTFPTDAPQGDTEETVSDPSLDGDTWTIEEGRLIGDPLGDSQYWFQQAQNGFCLPASIAQIVSEYTGVTYEDEMAFVEIANEIGAFVVSEDGIPGIPFEKGVEILNQAGVPAQYQFGDLESLASDLEAGYNVILFIDSGELWTGEATEDNMPDHAVVVTGIDTERGTVLLSDPGAPWGDLSEVPIDLFMNAWADSENAMIVCDKAPDEVLNTEEPVLTESPDEGTTDVLIPEGSVGSIAGASFDGSGDAAGGSPLESTTAWAVQHPWILLPVAIIAARLIAR